MQAWNSWTDCVQFFRRLLIQVLNQADFVRSRETKLCQSIPVNAGLTTILSSFSMAVEVLVSSEGVEKVLYASTFILATPLQQVESLLTQGCFTDLIGPFL